MSACRSTPATLRARLAWLHGGQVNGGRWRLHVERRRIRCGRERCRCAHGGDLHGPYVYLRMGSRRDGPRRRVYIPRAHVPTVQRWINDFREARSSMKLAMRFVAEICR